MSRNSKKLDGKLAIVTGASESIGAAIANALGVNGMKPRTEKKK